MRRLACLLALAGCAHGRDAAPADTRPIAVGFGPPPGLAQLEIARQERDSALVFDDQPTVRVHEEIRTRQREIWTPLKGGGHRLTAMLLDEEATQDGAPVASAVPLQGVPITQRIDAAGRFVEAEDVSDTVQAIEARAGSRELRRMLEPLLTPRLVADRMALAWRRRTEGLCGRTFVPGETAFGIDRQELPFQGPALSLVRARVEGRRWEEGRELLELSLAFAGADAAMVREPGAGAALGGLSDTETLATHATGSGRRLVDLASCQVVAEEAEVEGEWTLRAEAAAGSGGAALPKAIRFHVRRAARRTSGLSVRAAEPMP